MKTKFIIAQLAALLLSIASINAAGLLNERDLLFCPEKTAPQQAVGRLVQQRHQTAAVPAGGVLVKLFGADGEIIALQQVTMEEFMSGSFTRQCLPEGATFVMYHDHTAYYQTGADELVNPGT